MERDLLVFDRLRRLGKRKHSGHLGVITVSTTKTGAESLCSWHGSPGAPNGTSWAEQKKLRGPGWAVRIALVILVIDHTLQYVSRSSQSKAITSLYGSPCFALLS